jgi:hypothetical protein
VSKPPISADSAKKEAFLLRKMDSLARKLSFRFRRASDFWGERR